MNRERDLLERILVDQTKVPYSHGKIDFETIFDRKADRYAVIRVGRDEKRRRVHDALIHVDLIDGKFWVQHDGTEYGVARELMDAGIPKERIVMAFRWDEVLPGKQAAVA